MRVTQNMIANRFLNDLNNSATDLHKYQEQVSTGKRINRLSDDPSGAVKSLALTSEINRIDQYRKNIDDAKSWLIQSETAVMDVNDVIKTVYEKALQASAPMLDKTDRLAIAGVIESLRDQIVDASNASYGNRSIFSDEETLFNVGKGLQVNVVIEEAKLTGTGEKNLFKVLDDLISKLKDGESGEEVSPFIDLIQQKQNDILSTITEIGGRISRLDMMSTRYETDQFNYETILSDVEDVDMTEAIVNYRMAEATYQAALSANNKIVLPTLADFMNG